MALIVETGAGIAGANSYVSLVDAQAFIDARGLTSVLTEGLLLRAMDWLSTERFKGRKVVETNPLPWPRSDVDDCEGFDVAENAIPRGLIDAQIWLAYYTEQGVGTTTATTTQQVKKKVVDVLEIEYYESSGTTTAVSAMSMTNVRNALRCFVASPGILNRA